MTTINREQLLKSVQLVRPALSTQTFIPALSHIRICEGVAEAYNDVTAISVALPTGVADDLDFCVPGDHIIKVLNSFGSNEVLIKRKSKEQSITVTSGRSNLKVPTLPSSDFPLKWPTGKPSGTIALDVHILKALERCLISVGADSTHPAQMGVTLCADEDGCAVLYSTDNFTVSRATTDTPVKLPGGAPVILPTFFCEQLLSLSKSFPDEEAELLLYDGAVMAEVGKQASVLTKLVADLDPLDFQSILDKHVGTASIKKSHSAAPPDLEKALNRALLVLASSADKFTEFTCRDGILELYSTSDLGVCEDALEVDMKDCEKFIVDPAMVLRALKHCAFLTAKRGALVLSNNDGSFLHMISHCSA